MSDIITITNWMTETPGLSKKKLKEIVVPGTHHSESQTLGELISPCNTANNPLAEIITNFIMGGFFFNIVGKIIRNLAICQNTSVVSQLMSGVRYLDFRVCHDPLVDVYCTQHTVLGGPTSDGLAQIQAFLKIAKSELVFLEISLKSEDDTTNQNLIKLIYSYLGDYLAIKPNPNPGLQNLTYGDLIGSENFGNIGSSKVVVLYPHENHVNNHDFLWSMNSVNDLYQGVTNVKELEDYLNNQLSPSNPLDGLVKCQYILEFQMKGLNNPFQTLEDFESDLPDALEKFRDVKINPNVARINILFVDFFEKQKELMPWIFQQNLKPDENSGLIQADNTTILDMLDPKPDENSGGLYYEKTYQITSLLNEGGGLYCITQYEYSADNKNFVGYCLAPADPLDSRQHWRLRKNVLSDGAGGASLYNDASQLFLSINDCQNGNRHPVWGVSERSKDTALNIMSTEGFFVVRSYHNFGANLESHGDMGSNNSPIDTWDWTPQNNDGLNQKWQITEVSQHLQVPFMGIKLGTVYAITVGGFAITCDRDGTIKMKTFDQNNPDQYWTFQSSANGYYLYSPKYARYWSTGIGANSQLLTGAQDESNALGFSVIKVSTDLSMRFYTYNSKSPMLTTNLIDSLINIPGKPNTIGTTFKIVPINLQPIAF